MKYPGTNIFTDGSKHRRGTACYAALILCNDRFLYEITKAVKDTNVTAGQMEIEAICAAILWVAAHPDEAQTPYRLFTDYKPFVDMYNGTARDGAVGQAIKTGKEMGLEVIYIPAHSQEHNGNKACDITCRAFSGVIRRDGIQALSLTMRKAEGYDG